jgi:hypothetical protein
MWPISSSKTAYAEELRKLPQQEFDLELDTDKPYRNFQAVLISIAKNSIPAEKIQARCAVALCR